MGESSTKKRKRDGDSTAKAKSKSKKKVTIEEPSKPKMARITSIIQPECPPVIMTSAGIQLPESLSFKTYERKDDPRVKANPADQEIMLRSSDHPNIEYTATEDFAADERDPLKHFLGIYDPKTGTVELIEAKKMTVRGSVRSKQTAVESAAANSAAKRTMLERRTDLGETFGTKKAKKALHDKVLNAISPQKKPGDNALESIDAASKAMLQSVGKATTAMATREELQAVVDEAKPVPRPNLDADEIQDVYDPEVIIGADILNLVPVREWQEKVQHGEGVQVVSRFVANRVNAIAGNNEAIVRLRVLRYLYFVLLFYLNTKPGRQRGSRSIPAREKLREVLEPAPEAVIENIRRKFSAEGQMRKFHIDLLMTHMCAFACIVDNFEVDTQNLRDDLRLDQKTINQYFHEIGGRVKPVSKKAEGRQTHIARLMLPLDFPKQRVIRR